MAALRALLSWVRAPLLLRPGWPAPRRFASGDCRAGGWGSGTAAAAGPPGLTPDSCAGRPDPLPAPLPGLADPWVSVLASALRPAPR